jgi:acetyl-CoA carboxylase carboxyltransferase component
MIVGGSFGAGNYALCGRAFDPRFILAWSGAKFAVMGAEQASETLFSILSKAQSRKSSKKSDDNSDLEALRKKVRESYAAQTDIRYAAARGWVDAIVQPHDTRDVLIRTLRFVTRPRARGAFHTGVLQV